MRQQLYPRRLQRLPQLAPRSSSIVEASRRVPFVDRRLYVVLDHVEVVGQHVQESLAPARVERQVSLAERRRPGAR